MKTKVILALGGLLLLAAPARAVTNWHALLNGAQESPPFATPGSGVATASYDPNTDSLTVSMSYSDLIGTTTDSHIHCCFTDPPSRNIGVAVGFIPHGFVTGNTSGVFNAVIDLSNPANYTNAFRNNFGGGTAAGARDALLAGMTAGTAYFNIHTNASLSGEIRGDTIPIPEPTTLGIVLAGVVGLVYRRRSP